MSLAPNPLGGPMRPLPDQQSLDAVIAETWTALNQPNLTREQAHDLARDAKHLHRVAAGVALDAEQAGRVKA